MTEQPQTGGRRRAEPAKKSGRSIDAAKSANTVRNALASGLWLAAVVAAAFLAVGALTIALKFNLDNSVVNFITDTADRINVLGDMKTFKPNGKSEDAAYAALTKTVLVNWGIAAIGYLVVGKIAERIVRP